MPARSLKHYKVSPGALGGWVAVMPAVVPADRAFVISKIIVTTVNTSAVQFALGAGAGAGNPRAIVDRQKVALTEEFTDSGLVLVAGEQLEVWQYDGLVSTLLVQAFGEEVDN